MFQTLKLFNVTRLIATLTAIIASGTALAQTYHDKPVRVIVPAPAGGALDVVARQCMQKLGEALGAQFVVDNRGGGGGVIALEMLTQAPPDGYTLFGGASLIITATPMKKVRFDTRRVLAPVVQLTSSPFLLLAPPSLPAKRRRNGAKLLTWAAVLFFLLVAAAGAALHYFGPPAWAVNMGLVAEEGDPDLLFYLSKPAERRKLPTGEEYFAFGARIVNSGKQALPVPPVLVQLRDRQNRLVFSWTTKADKARLKPGEEASINESRIDIPKNAENLSLTFVE